MRKSLLTTLIFTLINGQAAEGSETIKEGKTVLFNYASNKKRSTENKSSSSVEISTEKNGKPQINKNEGSISIYFTPDIDLNISPKEKRATAETLFKLGEGDQQFKIIIYRKNDTAYLEFRHDATDNCSGAQCQRSVSTSLYDQGIVKNWHAGERHHIIVSWNFNKKSPSMDLYIDGLYAINHTKPANSSYQTFNPKFFYIGEDHLGNKQSLGVIENLIIYDKEFLYTENKINEYIEWKKDNGVWDSHETFASTQDAPKPIAITAPHTIFPTAPFTKVHDGATPSSPAIDLIEFNMLKNECETRFFNIYAGEAPLKSTQVSISDLLSDTTRISRKNITLRITHNWWQASNIGVMKTKVPTYTPELLIFNEPNFAEWERNKIGIPEDPDIGRAIANIMPHSSKQFSLKLCLANSAAAGLYTGTINIKTKNTPPTQIAVHLHVLDISLPKLSTIVTIYHESRFDTSPKADNYVSINTYQKHLDNIQEHGFNGLISYGMTKNYIKYAKDHKLDNFFCFATDDNFTQKIGWLNEFRIKPIFLGEDELHLFKERLPSQLRRAQRIHNHGAYLASAISKKATDALESMGSKLDYPILDIENIQHNGDIDFFNELATGKLQGKKNELIYWQATHENPLKNRFYAGYFLFISQLGGIAPYVYQKIRGNTFDDFSGQNHKERTLNLVYPSKNGLIDTLQWEALREGLDDYRLLELLTQQLSSRAKMDPEKTIHFNRELERLLSKYKSVDAYKNVSEKEFDTDRATIMRLIVDLKRLGNTTK